jgi:alanyl-tRNA synthetase
VKKVHLTNQGKTEDGRMVIGNVFQFIDTLGIPLGIVYDVLKREGCVIDWAVFIENALNAGWNPDTVKARILDTLLEKEEKQRFLYYWNVELTQ